MCKKYMDRYIDTLAIVPLPLRSSKHSPAFKLQKNLKQFKTHCRSLSLCSHGWQKIREGPIAGGRHVIYSKDETTDAPSSSYIEILANHVGFCRS